eukprot:1160316-Pelagomonas_calceolata.AAC.4
MRLSGALLSTFLVAIPDHSLLMKAAVYLLISKTTSSAALVGELLQSAFVLHTLYRVVCTSLFNKLLMDNNDLLTYHTSPQMINP